MAESRFSEEQLRTLVRETVVRVLSEFENGTQAPLRVATRKHLALLFSGAREPDDAVFDHCAALAARGHTLSVVASQSYAVLVGLERARIRLRGAQEFIENAGEAALHTLSNQCDALIIASLSLNSAAKIAVGIADSIPTRLVSYFVEQGKPVIVALDLATVRQFCFGQAVVPPRLVRAAEDHFHALEQLGLRFVPPSELEAAVDEAFHVPVNETPQRLARVRPQKRRQFITAEDVWRAASRGAKELVHEPDAIITDEARDSAQRYGIHLRSE
jgi:hypothetical protein